MTILYVAIAVLITLVISYVIFHYIPKGKIYEINTELIAQEQKAIEQLKTEQVKLQETKNIQNNEVAQLQHQAAELHSQLYQETNRLDEARVKNNQLINSMLQDNLAQIQERLDLASEKKSREYQEAEEEYQAEYAAMMQDMTEQYLAQIEILKQQISNVKNEYDVAQASLDALESKVSAAIEANKREEEKKTAADFYRVVIPESDLLEIAKLREVEPYLRDKEALNKVIWKVYYEKPASDMIGRVVGATDKTGIYKITDMTSGKCYVGQAVSFSQRWRQHIKRGLGAEAATRNKLYPAMKTIGVENFTFEIIEECSRAELDEKEDFWQKYFQANTYGYGIK